MGPPQAAMLLSSLFFSATSSRGWNWLETCDTDDDGVNDDIDDDGNHNNGIDNDTAPLSGSSSNGSNSSSSSSGNGNRRNRDRNRRNSSRALTLLEEVILPAVGSCCYTR